jgi:hypothetical protein
VIRTLLIRGMILGMVAGVLSLVFAYVFGEPGIDSGVALRTRPPGPPVQLPRWS